MNDPPVRLAIVSASDGQAIVLVAHPIAMDGLSLEYLIAQSFSPNSPSADLDKTSLQWLTRSAPKASEASSGSTRSCLEALTGAPESLDVIVDHSRPQVFSPRAGHFCLSFTNDIDEKLISFCNEHNLPLQAIFLGTLSAVLCRYARTDQVVFGISVNQREQENLEDIGSYRNLVPVLLRVPEDTVGIGLFESAMRELRRAEASKHVNFADVLELLAPRPDPSRSPVFQVSFDYIEREQNSAITHHFVGLVSTDLAITVIREKNGFSIEVEFPTALFDISRIERLTEHFVVLLAHLLDHPEASVRRHSLLSDDERAFVLDVGRSTDSFAWTGPIHGWIDDRAATCPDAIAITCGEQSCTYRELVERANQVSHKLIQLGITPNARVAVLLDRNIELITVLLGILKSGGAYVPIEPTNPADRVSFVLSDSKASVLLTDGEHLRQLGTIETPCLLIEKGLQNLGGLPRHSAQIPIDQATLAYVIYTSGSTGQPKGVLIAHAQLARLFLATDNWFHFGNLDVWTMFHSVAFDFSVWEIWGALCYGGRLVVVPHAVSRSPEDFYRLLAREGVTVLNQTPSAFRALIRAEDAVGMLELCLRAVIFGGEALEFESLRPWFDRHGDHQPKLINMYGITETTVHVTYRPVRLIDLEKSGGASLIGCPIPDLSLYVVESNLGLAPVGVPGEIVVGGAGVAQGYLDRPALTAERFVEDVFQPASGARLYRSGDLARLLPSGDFEYLGRIDHQVKIRGFRIETGEIEAVLRRSGEVQDVAVLARTRNHNETILAAYCVSSLDSSALRDIVRKSLPEYMVPSFFVNVESIPMTSNGKVDRRALPDPADHAKIATTTGLPRGRMEEVIAEAFDEALGGGIVDVERSFFDLGGTSITVVYASSILKNKLGFEVPVVKLFQFPAVRSLAEHLANVNRQEEPDTDANPHPSKGADEDPIAIVGMAGRFPGANNVDELWENLLNGVDSVTRFSTADLDPNLETAVVSDPAYVPARGILDGAELFDAEFFGISPREAQVTDPQQRVMLEVAWETLEHSGHDPKTFRGTIGVYCGEYNDSYYPENLARRPDITDAIGSFQTMVGNEKDFVATRIAHRLGLTGPAISVHTACSTSLVAVASAFWSLRTHQCDLALAGGVAVTFPQRNGHIYQEGGMLSADGCTRAFDASATGTVFSDGAAMVALRRLSDAIKDGDHIHAIIRGAAINNDGPNRMSFSAPSVQGQSECIRAAMKVAGVRANEISYVETHGTATPLGDPVEVEALRLAFGSNTRDQFCALGSIKSNIGHLTAPAGVTGLIKTALSLEKEKLPATLHYESPNPKIDFSATPFYVQATLSNWPRSNVARIAGVSSFGVGGTNAHVIVEEGPEPSGASPEQSSELLVLSAKTQCALALVARRLADYLEQHPGSALGNVAYTLQMGRQAMAHRRFVVATSTNGAASALRIDDTKYQATADPKSRSVVFTFAGQGSQYVGMGQGLYQTDSEFRSIVDHAAQQLRSTLACDIREILFADPNDSNSGSLLRQTQFTQPALLVFGYALADLWRRVGINADVMIGHSVGEITAAAISGVMSFDDALKFVAKRAQLMQNIEPGSMLAVRAAISELPELGGIDVAAINSPKLCVLSGSFAEIDVLAEVLSQNGISTTRLETSHAFHSAMMDPIIEPLCECANQLKLSTPRIPIVSTVTGDYLSAEQATSPMYWAQHARRSVRFFDGMQFIFREMPQSAVLEIGAREVLTTLARQCAPSSGKQLIIPSLEGAARGTPDREAWLVALGKLYLSGFNINWSAIHSGVPRRRVPLPTYAWDHKEFFVRPLLRTSQAPVAKQPVIEEEQRGFDAATLDTSSGDLSAIFEAQLALMAKQLEMLGSSQGTATDEESQR
jgi:amino acid adenylation domain-containing protein